MRRVHKSEWVFFFLMSSKLFCDYISFNTGGIEVLTVHKNHHFINRSFFFQIKIEKKKKIALFTLAKTTGEDWRCI